MFYNPDIITYDPTMSIHNSSIASLIMFYCLLNHNIVYSCRGNKSTGTGYSQQKPLTFYGLINPEVLRTKLMSDAKLSAEGNDQLLIIINRMSQNFAMNLLVMGQITFVLIGLSIVILFMILWHGL